MNAAEVQLLKDASDVLSRCDAKEIAERCPLIVEAASSLISHLAEDDEDSEDDEAPPTIEIDDCAKPPVEDDAPSADDPQAVAEFVRETVGRSKQAAERGDAGEALSLSTRALKASPNSVKALRVHAVALHKNAKPKDALKALSEAQSIDFDDEWRELHRTLQAEAQREVVVDEVIEPSTPSAPENSHMPFNMPPIDFAQAMNDPTILAMAQKLMSDPSAMASFSQAMGGQQNR